MKKIVLVGPPNSGKTSLYNWLTGSRFRTVNYPGATVEYSVGQTLPTLGEVCQAVDTPGLYSLDPKSPEEKVTVSSLLEGPTPDAVIAVVDATHLARHLVLVEQLRQTGLPLVMALTMGDLLRAEGLRLDLKGLEKDLGLRIFEVDGRTGQGVRDLVNGARELAGTPDRRKPQWSSDQIREQIKRQGEIAEARVRKVEDVSEGPKRQTQKIDAWVLHPVWGLLLFALIMFGLFSSIFWAAQPLMDLVDGGFSAAASWVGEILPPSLLSSFLTDGVIAGVGAVLVFVPQIFILFLGLNFLEDWGYLARGAALVDRPLSRLGLNGRSFVPLLSGHACAIPAMMAARTIPSTWERHLTLFLIPLMNCSARLPVYSLLLAFLFLGKPAWQPALFLAGIYITSLGFAAVAALIVHRLLPPSTQSWFMLELPIYRRPHPLHLLRGAFHRTMSYVTKAGGTILVLSMIIWGLSTFPNHQESDSTKRLETSYIAQVGNAMEPLMAPMGADWRVGVGLVSAFAAREVFVSTLAVIFHVTADEDSLQEGLLESLRSATKPDGQLLFTFASVMALIVFFMVALQCLSTVAVARKETGSWLFATVQLFTFTLVAYALAVGVYQFLRAWG